MHFTWVKTAEPWRIAQTHRPRAGAGLLPDLAALREAGADVLVSCQTEEEQARMGLSGEAEAAAQVGLEFVHFPIVDHSLPDDLQATVALADELAAALRAGRGVIAHCFAGIGRSGLIVVSTLLRLGMPLSEAVAAASEARGLPVPETRAQQLWLTQVEAKE